MTQPSHLESLLGHPGVCAALSNLSHLAAPTRIGPELRTTVRDVLYTFRSLRMFVITPEIVSDESGLTWQNSEEARDINWMNYAHYIKDRRVHLLDADEYKTERYFLAARKEGESGIWNCAATHYSICIELVGMASMESSVEPGLGSLD